MAPPVALALQERPLVAWRQTGGGMGSPKGQKPRGLASQDSLREREMSHSVTRRFALQTVGSRSLAQYRGARVTLGETALPVWGTLPRWVPPDAPVLSGVVPGLALVRRGHLGMR